MASIVKRTRADGSPSFFVKYRAGDGRTRWERFTNARDARGRKAQVELSLARSGGTWAPPPARTFDEAADAWIARVETRYAERTLHNATGALRKHLRPAFGPRPVASIRRLEVRDFAASLAAKGMAAGSIRQVTTVLAQVLGGLVEDGELEANVAAKLGRYGERRERRTAPTPEQVEKLVAAMRPEARPVVELAASTGLRRIELLQLRWADVELEAREIVIRRSKTAAGERVLPMFGSARRVLLEQKARSRFTRPEDLVFPTVVGTPESPNAWIAREFMPALKRAGLEGAFTFHALRHFAVPRLIEQGANILLVSRVAGHSRPSLTLDVYSHLLKEGLAEAAERFDPLASRKMISRVVDRR